jgi:hypothetical protein
MACHKHGMIPFTDQIRDGTAVGGDARLKVQRLYPEAKVMNAKVLADADRFLKALETATGPFLKVGGDAKKDLREFAEPVGETARLYRLQDLDLTMTACELDVEKPADLRTAIEKDPKLRGLGLAPLLQPGGAIKRADWERVDGTSVMQDTALRLKKATPRNVTR